MARSEFPTHREATGPVPAVSVENIVKRYGGVIANDRASLAVHRGALHGLVGQNGSGKTTLMKILAGILRPDGGVIRVGETKVRFGSPRHAMAAGIGMVPQDSMLADNLTVLENVVLGTEPARRGQIDRIEARRRIDELSWSCGLHVPTDHLVDGLGVAQRQRVEILRALYRGASVLILDEPTAPLGPGP